MDIESAPLPFPAEARVSYSATPRLVVGKMNGDNCIAFSSLVVPRRFAWLADLEPDGLMQFFAELLATVERAEESESAEELIELVDNWEESTEILSDPETVLAIAEARAEYAAGLTIPAEEVLARYAAGDE